MKPRSIDLTERVVLVTGSSRGIGRAIAKQFADSGASVAVHYHQDRRGAEDTLKALPSGSHHIFQADLAASAEAAQLVGDVLRAFGRLDVVVNNAGLYEEHPLLEVDQTAWQSVWSRTLAINLIGPAQITYEAARHMAQAGGGKIINISSRGAFRGEPKAPAYGASKAALNAMTQSLARELAPHGVLLYAVAPGWVGTDMSAGTLSGPEGDSIRAESPLGRVASPEEVAYTVLFLASDGTEYLTGAIVDINGASYLRS